MGKILITGGAGFIGSNLNASLVARGHETIVADRLRSNGKWRNIARAAPASLVAPESLFQMLGETPRIDAIFHLGAISSTTASDGDAVWQTNVALSQQLWHWCAEHEIPLIYASSAATYGDGSAGFDDAPENLIRLQPLNLYGWSKHVFDLWVMKQIRSGAKAPPQWAGLKFFNVYGPNEYHKGSMISVVKVKYDEIRAGQPPRLFRSTVAGLADGAQARDFIWVGDIVRALLWFLERREISGIFNLGTGKARTYLDLAHAVCDAAGAARQISFIDTPASLSGQYQNFTEARMDRLRATGFPDPFTSLEEGIGRYVREYLATDDPYC